MVCAADRSAQGSSKQNQALRVGTVETISLANSARNEIRTCSLPLEIASSMACGTTRKRACYARRSDHSTISSVRCISGKIFNNSTPSDRYGCDQSSSVTARLNFPYELRLMRVSSPPRVVGHCFRERYPRGVFPQRSYMGYILHSMRSI